MSYKTGGSVLPSSIKQMKPNLHNQDWTCKIRAASTGLG